MMRSISSPTNSPGPSSDMAARQSGPITTPAPWASSCATASTGCATPSAIPACIDTICVNLAWTGLHRRHRHVSPVPIRARWRSPTCVVIWGTNAVNTQVNVMTHAHARPQGARRQDRGSRHLHERHDEAGRSAGADPAGHRRRARLRGDACACFAMAWPTGPISSNTPTRRANSKRICKTRYAGMGRARSPAVRSPSIEAFARLIGETQAHLLPPRLRLLALAQRRGQHACRELHRGGDRRLAA